MMRKVFLLTRGDGDDGSEWDVVGIYSTRENADQAKVDYDTKKHFRPDGSYYLNFSNEIEEWEIDPKENYHGS